MKMAFVIATFIPQHVSCDIILLTTIEYNKSETLRCL